MYKTLESKRNFLICENLRKKEKDNTNLILMPICNNEKYGTLFIGTQYDYVNNKTVNISPNYLYRLGRNGRIESGMLRKNSDSFEFVNTHFYFLNKTERKYFDDVFRLNTERYRELLKIYGDDVRRVQHFKSNHPKLRKLKGLAISNADTVRDVAIILGLAGRSRSF